MAKRDYYEVLGVNKTSKKDEIKKAYRKLSLKYHPDKNKGDKISEEKFKEASEAYHVLSDDKRKANYDQFGHAAFQGAGGQGGFGNFDFSSSFSDIFEDVFGDLGDFGFGSSGRSRRRSNNRGSDLRYDISIDLKNATSINNAMNGTVNELRITTNNQTITYRQDNSGGYGISRNNGIIEGSGTEITHFPIIDFRTGLALGGTHKRSISMGVGFYLGPIKFDFGLAYRNGYSINSLKGFDLSFTSCWR